MCKEGQCIILRFPPSLIRGGKEVARGGAPGLEVTTYRCSIFLWERGPALQGPWMQESGKVEEGGAACRQEGWCVTYTEGPHQLGSQGRSHLYWCANNHYSELLSTWGHSLPQGVLCTSHMARNVIFSIPPFSPSRPAARLISCCGQVLLCLGQDWVVCGKREAVSPTYSFYKHRNAFCAPDRLPGSGLYIREPDRQNPCSHWVIHTDAQALSW